MGTDSQDTAKQAESLPEQPSTKLTKPVASNLKKSQKPAPESSELSTDLKHQAQSPVPSTPNPSSAPEQIPNPSNLTSPSPRTPRTSERMRNTRTKSTQNQLEPNDSATRSLVSLSSKEDSEDHQVEDSVPNTNEKKQPSEEKQSEEGLRATKSQNDTAEAEGDAPKNRGESSSVHSSSASESSEDGEQDSTSSDEGSSSSSEASIPSKRPRKRPSCNGIVRRMQGKKPRQMPPPPSRSTTTSPKQERQSRATARSKPSKLSTPTAVKVIGKRGATITEALAELDKRASAKRGRGRPSKIELAERKRFESLKTTLQKEFVQLSSPGKGSGVKALNTNGKEDDEASSGEELSSESSEENDEPDDVDKTNEDRNMRSRTRPIRGNKSQKSIISDASGHSNTIASKTPGIEGKKKSGEKPGLNQPAGVGEKSAGSAVGKKKIPDSVKKSLREALDGKSLSSLSDQNDLKGSPARKEQQALKGTDLKSGTMEQNGNNVPLLVVKKRRGRPPGSKNKTSKTAKKVSFSGISKNKRLSANVQDEELTTRRKAALLSVNESENSDDNSRAHSDSEGNGSGRQLRKSTRRKTSKSLIQDESSFLIKDHVIEALRAELDLTKEKLDREASRAQELDEALGLPSKGDGNDLFKYDEMCNRISELESKVVEQQQQLSERDDTLREKEAAMKGFLEQIKSFESRFEKGESRPTMDNGVRGNDNGIYTSVERLVELEADLENKTIEMQKLQTLVEAQQKTLRNVLIANKNLQQKIYKQAGVIGVDEN